MKYLFILLLFLGGYSTVATNNDDGFKRCDKDNRQGEIVAVYW